MTLKVIMKTSPINMNSVSWILIRTSASL